MNRSKLAMPVLFVAAVAALAGCQKRPADAPMTPTPPSTSTTPAPMPPASAASQ
jgi:type IV pilus biogenesis protein CpaD/CtpE